LVSRIGVWCGAALALAACTPIVQAPPPEAPPPVLTPVSALASSRWTWLSAQCVDGGLTLDPLGFERTLDSDVRGNRLLLTYDTLFVDPICVSTEVWSLSPVAGGQWWFSPEARVTQPPRAPCGAHEDAARQGVLRMTGDTLEEIHFGSEWCRGFDVRFSYRRTSPQALDAQQLVRRYLAHWNRRDPRAVASLFASEGVLVESLSRSPDGAPVRHEGRANVEAWLADAFATTPWLAMQLTDIDVRSESQATATWRYMDARLAEPVEGRNLFVLAGGEIFATELQLLSSPVPRPQTAP
jgi:ketosteroid isomerase-like protein